MLETLIGKSGEGGKSSAESGGEQKAPIAIGGGESGEQAV